MQTKPMLRAVRRHHVARLKKSRASYWSARHKPNSPEQLGKLVQTPAICSCPMCGNPRKYRDLATHQEQAMLQEGLHRVEDDELLRMPNLALRLPKPNSW